MNIYAAYRGDTFLDLGTAKQLSASLGVAVKTIRWLTTPSGQKRTDRQGENTQPYEKRLIIIKLEKEDE